VLEWLRVRATAARERDARAQGRQEALEDKRIEFQRDTLLSLQDTLREHWRGGVLIWSTNLSVKRRTGTWADSGLSDDDDLQLYDATIRLNALSERVLDDDLRRLVAEYKNCHTALAFARNEADANLAHDMTMEAYNAANSRLGSLLRALY